MNFLLLYSNLWDMFWVVPHTGKRKLQYHNQRDFSTQLMFCEIDQAWALTNILWISNFTFLFIVCIGFNLEIRIELISKTYYRFRQLLFTSQTATKLQQRNRIIFWHFHVYKHNYAIDRNKVQTRISESELDLIIFGHWYGRWLNFHFLRIQQSHYSQK